MLPKTSLIWHLSPDIKYKLKEIKSPLVCNTIALMKDNEPDTYDLSKVDFKPEEVILMFYLINFPDSVTDIPLEYIFNVVTLISLYATELVDEILYRTYEYLWYSSDSENRMIIWWDVIYLYQKCQIEQIPANIRSKRVFLMMHPYTLYNHCKDVDITYLCDYTDIIENWSDGCLDKLKEIEESRKGLILRYDGVREYIRIPHVAKSMGYNFTMADNIQCGKCVSECYVDTFGRGPNAIRVDIDGTSVSIKHYKPEDYYIVVRGIEKYLEEKNKQITAPIPLSLDYIHAAHTAHQSDGMGQKIEKEVENTPTEDSD